MHYLHVMIDCPGPQTPQELILCGLSRYLDHLHSIPLNWPRLAHPEVDRCGSSECQHSARNGCPRFIIVGMGNLRSSFSRCTRNWVHMPQRQHDVTHRFWHLTWWFCVMVRVWRCLCGMCTRFRGDTEVPHRQGDT